MSNSLKRALLYCEGLEGRDCPAVQVFNTAGILSVVGTGSADNIAITDLGNGEDISLQVQVEGQTVTIPTSDTAISQVVVQGLGGNDTITYTASATSSIHSVTLAGSSGDDTITLDASTLNRTDVTNATTQLVVGGGQGADSINVSLGNIAVGDSLSVFVNGGGGSDTQINLNVNGTIDGVLTLLANGSLGNDTVNASINGTVSSGGTATIVVSGGQGTDAVNVSGSVAANGTLTVQANGGQGDDTISLDTLTILDDSAGTISVGASGGQGVDNITLNLIGEVDGSLTVFVDAGQDNDTVHATTNITDNDATAETVTITVKGGQGADSIDYSGTAEVNATTLTTVVSGGSGADTIASVIDFANTSVSSASNKVTGRVSAGAGNDDLTSRVRIGGAAATASALNALLGTSTWSFILDGVIGFDTGTFTDGVVTPVNIDSQHPE